MNMRALLFLSAFFLLAACGQSHPWGKDYDALAHRPGAKVAMDKDAEGNPARTIVVPGQISVVQVRKGKTVLTAEEDISGHGAVVCARDKVIQMRGLLEACGTDEDAEREGAMDDSITRINRFIAANSVTPVTLHALEIDAGQRIALVSKEILKHPRAACHTPAQRRWLKKIDALTAEKIEDSTDDLLSVPRPPVLKPCG
jgi:hypothetical protein